ncbi:FAD binding domain-containing protein [Lichenihabitans sp. Uapishka_5]|uniref:FAD binding domain-containing protein n=1 Tax=Lichenihabitans sp. Uapishka_5 TaxID=3037302 RepID=UPI0029E7CD6A|nr:FAD binding domain-containing protein [Lichenihabitans sp. Uapishka_5]MDX7949841.1 FAD binding domain-containing protein [Lichenihabitans sp. Uapishka_5]
MDLNTVEAVLRPATRHDLQPFRPGDAWLAGGTWLLSEPQRHLRRLIDLSSLGWPALEVGPDGLSIGATCPVATLESFEPPASWRAGSLIAACCHALWASFKIWNTATVGGNLCLALPAAPLISLAVALDASCLIWTSDGTERRLPALDLVLGPQRTALAPGDLLRRIDIPAAAFRQRSAFRQMSLTPLGRSAALLIGTRHDSGEFCLTVTASTPRPLRLAFDQVPSAEALRHGIDATIPIAAYFDDVHGAPDWRQHLTRHLAEEIRAELSA